MIHYVCKMAVGKEEWFQYFSCYEEKTVKEIYYLPENVKEARCQEIFEVPTKEDALWVIQQLQKSKSSEQESITTRVNLEEDKSSTHSQRVSEGMRRKWKERRKKKEYEKYVEGLEMENHDLKKKIQKYISLYGDLENIEYTKI